MRFIVSLLVLIFSLNVYSQSQVLPEDLKILIGEWEGSITYLDYQTNKPFTMPANLVVEQGKNKYQLVLKNSYPNEPKANSSDKIKIAKDGMQLNNNTVILKESLKNGDIKIQTEKKGKDDNKQALIRYTYTVENDNFSIKKEVQFNQEDEWIKRSEFNYKRKN